MFVLERPEGCNKCGHRGAWLVQDDLIESRVSTQLTSDSSLRGLAKTSLFTLLLRQASSTQMLALPFNNTKWRIDDLRWISLKVIPKLFAEHQLRILVMNGHIVCLALGWKCLLCMSGSGLSSKNKKKLRKFLVLRHQCDLEEYQPSHVCIGPSPCGL